MYYNYSSDMKVSVTVLFYGTIFPSNRFILFQNKFRNVKRIFFGLTYWAIQRYSVKIGHIGKWFLSHDCYSAKPIFSSKQNVGNAGIAHFENWLRSNNLEVIYISITWATVKQETFTRVDFAPLLRQSINIRIPQPGISVHYKKPAINGTRLLTAPYCDRPLL